MSHELEPLAGKEIEQRLRERLGAVHVEVEDEGHLHAGHGASGGHYRAVVVAERFAGLSRVAAQRAVYAALGEWMDGPIHAFAVRTFTPEQWGALCGARPAHGQREPDC